MKNKNINTRRFFQIFLAAAVIGSMLTGAAVVRHSNKVCVEMERRMDSENAEKIPAIMPGIPGILTGLVTADMH
jgi:hypothetical protein